MPRYINADKFAERLKVSPAFPKMGMYGHLLRNVVLDILDNMPTADVAPRSESIPVDVSEALKKRQMIRLVWEIFWDIEALIERTAFADCWSEGGFKSDIAELKKKYTEGNDENI